MIRIIYLSVAVLVFSFAILPILNDVSKERDAIIASNNDAPTLENDTISFEEIYALADETIVDSDNPAFLNNIAPAAGLDEDEFTSGFRGLEDSALADTPAALDRLSQDNL
ncbi:MAG: hypothetical protein GW903_06035 [Alphaproteobacteria bacterium]|nr:hypothetical protein [Alphaproteobacteria bacterium]NCQ88439.1 hypothetical protein [Alphaproteobacteria bacterium]NCT05982.1 hypothetical protein [Alphaproteobacteria bacterium]